MFCFDRTKVRQTLLQLTMRKRKCSNSTLVTKLSVNGQLTKIFWSFCGNYLFAENYFARNLGKIYVFYGVLSNYFFKIWGDWAKNFTKMLSDRFYKKWQNFNLIAFRAFFTIYKSSRKRYLWPHGPTQNRIERSWWALYDKKRQSYY